MIDDLALAVSHLLLILTAWALMRRPDLDDEGEAAARGRWPRA